MSIVTENQQRPTHTGSGIIFIIVAIAALASLAVGMSTMSRISTVNQLQFNQANSARNLALSGIEYAKGVAYAYAHLETPKTLPEVTKYLSDNPTYNLGDSIGSFTLTDITTGTNSFSVKAIGSTPSGGNMAKYKTESSTTIPYDSGDIPIDKSLYAMQSTADVTLNGDNNITGSIYGKSSATLNGGAVVDGNVISGGCVTINKGTVTGNVCTTCSSASWSSTTEVDGNVVIFGDLTMNGGTYKGDVYVTGKLTVNNNAKISGNIYAGSIYINSINLSGNAYASGTINKTGTKYHPNTTIPSPDSCTTPTITPRYATIKYATDSLLIQDQDSYTFNADNNNDNTYNSIDFTQITLNNTNKILYFDLSKGDINILVTGNVTFNQAFTIMISQDGKSWETYNPDKVTDAMKKYSKRIYLESHETITFNGASNWVGTLYAKKVVLNKSGLILGTIYSPFSIIANSGVDVMIMPSNFVDKWWTK